MLIELKRRRCSVNYVGTAEGHAVDFLARRPDGTIQLIQVSAGTGSPQTAARELRALEATRQQSPKAERLLLTLTRDRIPVNVPKGVEVQPAYEWMLTAPDDN